jgi:hypothetical protein
MIKQRMAKRSAIDRNSKWKEEDVMHSLVGLVRVACLGSLLAFGPQSAFAADTPTKLDGATTITADQAKDLVAKGTPIIDARVANEYAEAHVKGAINASERSCC